MTIVVTEPAVGEAVTLAGAKAHLRVETDAEDELLQGLIGAARQHLESVTGLALLTQGFRLYLDDWPKHCSILIRKHPVRTLEAVTVCGADGTPEEADLARVTLDAARRPARLVVGDMPSPGRAINGIEIDFTAGFGESGADAPDVLKRAMLIHVAQMYELRGAVTLDRQPAIVPEGYNRLIAPWRRRGL